LRRRSNLNNRSIKIADKKEFNKILKTKETEDSYVNNNKDKFKLQDSFKSSNMTTN
jgi:hypothetical protein